MRKFTLLFVILLALLTLTPSVYAADLVFEWDPNPTTDEVLNYILYEYQGNTWVEVGRVDGSVFTLTLADVSPSARRYHLTAANHWGESGSSNEVTLPAGVPNAPNLRITVTIEITQ